MKSKFTKNMEFPPKGMGGEDVARSLALVMSDPGSFECSLALLAHEKHGAQMWVSKEVSDDLSRSRIDDISFGDVEWPCRRLEVVFEDPELPSFVTAMLNEEYRRREFCDLLGIDDDTGRGLMPPLPPEAEAGRTVLIMAETSGESAMAYVINSVAKVDEFARGEDEMRAVQSDSILALDLPDDERLELQRLLVMLFKVLLFAGSEGCAPRQTREKPTKKQGGKPGVRNRPSTKRLIVEYLPRQLKERTRQAQEAGKSHRFLGRVGHWREFKSEKFRNVRGTRKFIYPVPGPDGTVPRKKFIVRKPHDT